MYVSQAEAADGAIIPLRITAPKTCPACAARVPVGIATPSYQEVLFHDRGQLRSPDRDSRSTHTPKDRNGSNF
jgi:hypothetical protein